MKPMLLHDVKEERLSELFDPDRWVMQRKLDGERLIVQSQGGYLTLWNKQGAMIGRKPNSKGRHIILDGEQIEGVFHAFDLLELDGQNLRGEPLSLRLSELRRYLRTNPVNNVRSTATFKPSPDRLELCRLNGWEGVVFKDLRSQYQHGRRSRLWLKYKFTQTTEVIVVGLNRNGKRAVETAYADGTLAAGVGLPEGMEVEIGDIIEVKYLYATPNRKLYQPIFIRVRHDCQAADCTWDRLKYKEQSPVS